MKNIKTLLTASAAAAAVTLGATPAMAELEASAAVSNIYLFRGIDQGGGSGAVSGDLVYSTEGFYAGVWASSASNFGNGGEIDTFIGWGGEFNGIGVDIGVLDYYYPGTSNADSWGNSLTEAYLGLSMAGLEFYYYDQISGESTALDDNSYMSLSYSMGQFSALVGYYDLETPSGAAVDNEYTHVDLTYAYNDNLSFTLSQLFADDDAAYEDDAQVVVTYSIPLK